MEEAPDQNLASTAMASAICSRRRDDHETVTCRCNRLMTGPRRTELLRVLAADKSCLFQQPKLIVRLTMTPDRFTPSTIYGIRNVYSAPPLERYWDERPDALAPVGLSVNADSRTWTCALARSAECNPD